MYADVQHYIKAKDYNQARKLLNSTKKRTAIWYYLSSVVAHKTMWFDTALSHINKAIELDDKNDIYKRFHAKLMSPPPHHHHHHHHHGGPPHYRRSGCCCDCCCCNGCCEVNCMHLICADSCCECMGGDLISCI